jgi:hypothetical protein
MDRRDHMRAADSDREAVAEQLRAALGEGRLDLHEFDERVRRAYAARTYAELGELLTDLPETIPPGQAQVVPAGRPAPPEPVAAAGTGSADPAATRRWLGQIWGGYLGTVAIVVAIWAVTAVTSGVGYFWPIWVAGPWGAILLARTVSGLAQGEPRRSVVRREHRRQARDERRLQGRVHRRDERAGSGEDDLSAAD